MCQLSQHLMVPCNECALAGVKLHILSSKLIVFLEVKSKMDTVVESFGGQKSMHRGQWKSTFHIFLGINALFDGRSVIFLGLICIRGVQSSS